MFHRTHFAHNAVVGWRIRQANDQGIGAILDELAKRPEGVAHDAAGVSALEAAIRLMRADLAAPHLGDLAKVPTVGLRRTESTVGPLLAAEIDLLVAAVQLQPSELVADDVAEALVQLCTSTNRRIRVATKVSTTDAALPFIDAAPSLLRAVGVLNITTLTKTTRVLVRRVIEVLCGEQLSKLVDLGGNAQRLIRLLEAITLLADDRKRPIYAETAVRCFDEMVYTRLYVTGAVALPPQSDSLVRQFGVTHLDGVSRSCVNVAWLRWLQALRPLLTADDRANELDDLIERVVHNPLLVAVGVDPTRWFGPIPHSVDRTEDANLFVDQLPAHRFVPGSWRPNMRHSGTCEHCCAASAMLGLSLIEHLSIRSGGSGTSVRSCTSGGSGTSVRSCTSGGSGTSAGSDQSTLFVHQLDPGDTSGDGWEIHLSGTWPYEGDLALTVRSDIPRTVLVRIPPWADTDATHAPLSHADSPGWARYDCEAGTSSFTLDVSGKPRLVEAHPLYNDIRGCVAMMAGPFVYCLEGADQMGHLQPRQVRFDPDGAVSKGRDSDHPEGHPTIHATGEFRTRNTWPDYAGSGAHGYRRWVAESMDLPVDITFIPWFTIANRGLWEMSIWIPLATSSE
jgi:hypothetical protein